MSRKLDRGLCFVLQGKQIVITGASSGIGAASARAFAALGARVVLLARTRVALETIADEIRAQRGVAHVYPVDLRDLEATARVCARVEQEVGVPDILVNNAGSGRWLHIEETATDEAAAMIALPYLAAFAVTRAFVEPMLGRGSGHIINITSPAAFTPFPGAVAYSVARAAMRDFTNALHSDLRGTRLKTSLVVCGVVETEYFRQNPGSRERIPGVSRLFPILSAEQAADAIVRVASTGRRRLIVPARLRWMLWSWFAFPWLAQALVNASGHRRPSLRSRFG